MSCASSSNEKGDEQAKTDDRAQSQSTETEDEPRGPERPRDLDIPGVTEEDRNASLEERLERNDAKDEDANDSPESKPADEPGRRAVAIPTDDLTLRGTLHLPKGAEESPAPGIVLTHGSGPLSRGEYISGQFLTHFGFEIAVFEELAEQLADAGYVVLRYDKRTCRGSNNDHCRGNKYPEPDPDITIDAFISDASDAVDWLAERDFVDPEKLVVLGHSQGANFVPNLMKINDSIRAGVMVAAPFRPVDEAYRAQANFLREMLKKSGMPEDRIRSMKSYERMDEIADSLERLRAGRYDGERLGGASVDFWTSWMRVGDDAPKIARKLDRPLLVLSGTYDYNVLPEETKLWRKALADANEDPGHRVAILDCITHALNCIAEEDPFKVKPDDLGRHVHAKVIKRIVSFLGDAGIRD